MQIQRLRHVPKAPVVRHGSALSAGYTTKFVRNYALIWEAIARSQPVPWGRKSAVDRSKA